jgi:hypothetical protein
MDRHGPIIDRLLSKCKAGCIFLDHMALREFTNVYLCYSHRVPFIGIPIYCIGIFEYIWMA